MANNMTIGPALSIGGNTVEMTTNGKVQVTNTRGKVKTLSQDQFKKQLIKNADKIEAGQDFEFKKDHKTAKVIGVGLATAAVVTGAIYRKEIGQYIKNFSWKKFGQDIKDLFSKVTPNKKDKKDTKIRTVFDGEFVTPKNATDLKVAGETLEMKNAATKEIAESIISNVEKIKSNANEKGIIHKQRQAMYEKLFGEKAPVETK